MAKIHKVSIKEKIGYALGDGAANIAWRGVATFLFIFLYGCFWIKSGNGWSVVFSSSF